MSAPKVYTANLERDVEVAEVQRTYNVEVIPGTEVMTDLGHVHFAQSEGKVLVPQPHNDPNDPLNWSKSWKQIVMVGQFLVAFVQAVGPLSIAPQTEFYMAEWNRSLSDVLQFTGVCILVFGFSNFIWVPIATKWGRRPALILSALTGIGACIWRARAQSYGSFMGACVVHGIAAGPSETLPPMLIADVMFLHERGFYMGMYMWAYFGAYELGPVIAGVMSERYGWRSFWWFNVAAYCVLTLYTVFLIPETKWNRGTAPGAVQDEHIFDEKSAEDSQNEVVMNQDALVSTMTNGEVQIEHKDEWIYKGKPSRGQFSFVSSSAIGYDRGILLSLWIPVKLFSFPIVEWASFVFSWSASNFLMLNLTESQAFQADPYNFTSEKIGYFNLAMFGGSTVGLLVAGPLSDYISMRATKKNHGIREPEMRLPTLIPFTVLLIVGALVSAFGYAGGWKWEIIVLIGYFFIGIQVAAIPAIATTYAIDSYKPVAGDFLVSATVNKNVWAYGLSKFLTDWVDKAGFVKPMATNMALCVFWILFAIPLFYYGKTVRRWTKDSNVHSL
ncbi:putative MFS transporter [Limtongia smithiae]|uniref:putative MFS transporter n=1 Tax=Limtongia smithiae TaxID=1125753 RepID=UPI0034CED35A